MFLKSTLISTCLLASAVLANSHHHRRRHSFLSPNLASRDNTEEVGTALAGIIDDGIESASATFKLPAVGKTDGTALIAISLDYPNKGCENSLLVGIALNEPGSSSPYTAFGSFSADQPTIFNDLSLSAGEEVTMTVTSDSARKGTVTINSHSYHLTTETPLCKNGAFFSLAANPKDDSDKEFYPLPHFGTLTFDNAKVTTSSGTKVIDSSDAHVADMEIDGVRVVKTSLGYGTVIFKQQK